MLLSKICGLQCTALSHMTMTYNVVVDLSV